MTTRALDEHRARIAKLDPSRVIDCPSEGCTEKIERGGSCSENKSGMCDRWDHHAHTHCTG